MTPFRPAKVALEEKIKVRDSFIQQWRNKEEPVFSLLNADSEEEAIRKFEAIVDSEASLDMYVNDKYQVAIRDMGEFVHLSIKRIDREPIHDWRELQQIKTELIGPECEAVELYPAESRVIDTANQFHLWACKDPKFRFPLGFDSKRVVTDNPLGDSKNRPLGNT